MPSETQHSGTWICPDQKLPSQVLQTFTLGASTISIGELEECCQKNSALPADNDEPFVVRFEMNHGHEKTF